MQPGPAQIWFEVVTIDGMSSTRYCIFGIQMSVVWYRPSTSWAVSTAAASSGLRVQPYRHGIDLLLHHWLSDAEKKEDEILLSEARLRLLGGKANIVYTVTNTWEKKQDQTCLTR